jgi:deoxyribodipyrimidine photolyase-related protein
MVFVIFPHQLYSTYEHLPKNEPIYLIEEPRYFTDFKFHKLKLAYHRATMKKYEHTLTKKGYDIHYLEYHEIPSHIYRTISCIEVGDFVLERKFKDPTLYPSPNFLITTQELPHLQQKVFKGKYSHTAFYHYQRTKLNILMENHKPIGKWSYDTDNRMPLPKSHSSVPITLCKANSYTKEAIRYVEHHFPKNYGSLDHFVYPIDSARSKKWLYDFLDKRLQHFGTYEDAVAEKDTFVYHSVLSPMMNIGLLTDHEVVHISYDYYLHHKIPIASFEGFIRQIIGWRNYMYTIYLLEEHMPSTNQLHHKNPLPYSKLWECNTGIYPIDSILHKIVKYGYAHHIERLMYLGNFLLLCQIHPQEVYTIFMEWTIDAYDWVMVPNVFAMSQYATPLLTTRPYFSSSNYMLKMSDYKRGEWCDIIDALYYRFIHTHQDVLRKNYSTANQVKLWNSKTEEEQKKRLDISQRYLRDFLE